MKKIAFYTLGCRANQYQTFCLKCQMSNVKCQTVAFTGFADTYVINTCTVTEDAERKSRQAIRRALRQNPEAKVIVTGCHARLAEKHLKNEFPMVEFLLKPRISFSGPIAKSRVRANLMIQDGCEHFCSYCIVPLARGKITSKSPKQVLDEANQLVRAGAREIVLTGINLGTYQFSLPALLNNLSLIPKLSRIRLSSLEPMYITKELIDKIAKTPKVCKHLHIPLQSGNNTILKAMRRNYTRNDFLELVDYTRGKIPECGITTDIIVGFPGEGEREFQDTVDLIEQIKFSRLHVFPYSKRQDTPAAKLQNQVDGNIKKERSKLLHKLRTKYMFEFANQYKGKEVEILVEQKGEGLTSNYIRCFFNDPADSSGALKRILAKTITALGEIKE